MTAPSPVRTRTMRAVKSKDTVVEMKVRRLVHSLGYRYRLHHPNLPGAPDLVFPARRAIIFVHGCFWHQHECRRGARIPKTRREYWEPKLRRTEQRDAWNETALRLAGWRVLVIWECETGDRAVLEDRLRDFLDSGRDDAGVSQPAEP